MSGNKVKLESFVIGYWAVDVKQDICSEIRVGCLLHFIRSCFIEGVGFTLSV